MKKDLFKLVVKQAHMLAKKYIAMNPHFKVDYKAQYSIFFKLVYAVYKKKEADAVAPVAPVVENENTVDIVAVEPVTQKESLGQKINKSIKKFFNRLNKSTSTIDARV